jgi:hypothetical protein
LRNRNAEEWDASATNRSVIPYESTMLVINAYALAEDKTAVMVFAMINQNVPVTPALYEWVATSHRFIFGHINMSVREDDSSTADLTFGHSLFGETLNEADLKSTLGTVATSAVKLDADVKARFGGDRWIDR